MSPALTAVSAVIRSVVSMSEIDALLNEDRSFVPSPEWRRSAIMADPGIYDRAAADLEGFWAGFANELEWMRPWDAVLEWRPPHAKWFVGGQLNISANCLDRHVRTARRNKAAFIWEGEPGDRRTLTYWDLYRQVCAFANVLKSLGVKRGDRVALYLPLIPELAIAMLACARIGAVHSVVFGGFSSESLRDRINDSQCVAARDRRRRLSARPDRAAQADGRRSAARHAVDQERRGRSAAGGRSFPGRHPGGPRSLVPPSDAARVSRVRAGSDGRRGHAVHPLHVRHHREAEGHRAHDGRLPRRHVRHDEVGLRSQGSDVYWCTADIGWVTGHSYVVYGPLANGATVVMYEGAPDWPQKDRFWEIIERHGVTIFYTAPTAIRAFMRWGTEWPEKRDLSTLRLLGSVGEPINPEAWMWYHQHIGGERCPIVDTWWQTETGMIMITPLAGHHQHETRLGHAAVSRRRRPRSVTRQGKRVETGGGLLTLTKPWPAMLRGIYGDPERFVQQYWSRWTDGTYFTGDGARRDEDGFYWLLGRVDDVLNVAGHRLGTMEVESALVDHPKVAEAAVVGRPHEIKGQAVAAFVTVKEGVKATSSARRRAERARRQEDRRDCATRPDSLCRRSAEDALRQDHAPAAARHRRRQGARRHDDAGRSGGCRAAQERV